MKRYLYPALASLYLLAAAAPIKAGNREMGTVESAVEVVKGFTDIPLRCIPPALMREAKGVAIIPHVVKAGFLVDGRFGRGIVMMRLPDGTWSDPVFVTLRGGGAGLEAGVESTDLVLIFKTAGSLDRIMKGKGKVALGSDVTLAIGPIGRDAELATDALLKAEIVSYSRSRGLFAGASVEGSHLWVDGEANEEFYHIRHCHPADVLGRRGPPIAPPVVVLKVQLTRLAGPPAVIVVPTPVPVAPYPVPPPVAPYPVPPQPYRP